MIPEFKPKPEGHYSNLPTIARSIANFDYGKSSTYECFMIGVAIGTYLMLFEAGFLFMFGMPVHQPFIVGFLAGSAAGLYIYFIMHVWDFIQDGYKRHLRDFSRWKNENPI